MRIQKRLQINIALSVFTVVIVCLLLFWSLYRIDRASDLAKIAGEMTIISFERVTLRADYLRTGNERSRKQVVDRHKKILELLTAARGKFTKPEDQKTIGTLIKNHAATEKIFRAIVENREKRASGALPEETARTTEDRLVSQLNMTVYETVIHERQLMESGRKARESAQTTAGGAILAVLVLLSCAIFINSRTMSRSVTDRVQKLCQGAMVIGEGDLNHRIGIRGNDEFAKLSAAFDGMAAKLQVSYNDLACEIARRTEAQAELTRQREWLSVTLASIGDAVIATDAEGRITFMNAVAESLTGWSREEAAMRPVTEVFNIVNEHTREVVASPVARVLAEGLIVGLANHTVLIRKDQREVPIDDSGAPIRDVDGKILGAVLVFRDISERKIIEEKIRRNTILLNQAGKLAKVGGWEIDVPTMTQTWTDETYEIHGVDKETYNPNVDREINAFPPASKPLIEKAVYDAIHYGMPYDLELEFITADGVRKITRAIGNAEMENGITKRVYGIFQDITQQKTAEAELQERTAQLEAANRELESFSYSVSHDLRAPLRAINGYARMILKQHGDRFDENTARQFSLIRENSRIMGDLIDSLLSFSRLPKAGMTPALIDMSKLVTDIYAEVAKSDGKAKPELKAAGILPCYGDYHLIRQVLFNLIENAVKFSGNNDRGMIEIGSHAEDGKIIYYVKDNGAGFDMAYYDKLFGVFQRLHTHEEFEGTGVGLATVQRIIHRHGGRVWAEGVVDEGATFYFTLPTCPE